MRKRPLKGDLYPLVGSSEPQALIDFEITPTGRSWFFGGWMRIAQTHCGVTTLLFFLPDPPSFATSPTEMFTSSDLISLYQDSEPWIIRASSSACSFAPPERTCVSVRTCPLKGDLNPPWDRKSLKLQLSLRSHSQVTSGCLGVWLRISQTSRPDCCLIFLDRCQKRGISHSKISTTP